MMEANGGIIVTIWYNNNKNKIIIAKASYALPVGWVAAGADRNVELTL
jgi:hypothetical protein